MSDTSWATLRHVLLTGYAEMVSRLTYKLGSRDLAQDALHDTYLRLERGGDLAPVHKPKAFLMRMALNSASNQRRSEGRLISSSEGRVLLDVIDEGPDPEQTALARSDIDRLRVALDELPARRRAIFMAAWSEGLSRQDIADRLGIAVRTVKHELTLARQYCAGRLGHDEKKILPFAPRQLSSDRVNSIPADQDAPGPREASET